MFTPENRKLHKLSTPRQICRFGVLTSHIISPIEAPHDRRNGHHLRIRAMADARLRILFFLLLLLLLFVGNVPPVACSAHPGYPEAADECSGSGGGELELVAVRREEYGAGRIVDISHAYREDMPGWELEEGLGRFLQLTRSMAEGDVGYFSQIKLPAHSGTHVDAPGHVFRHYFEAGFDVDTLDLDVLNGPALLVDVPRDKNLTAEVMMSLNIPKGVCRVLFRTLNTDRQLMWKKAFDTSYVGFMKDGAQWLVDNTDIKLVGIDYLSVAAYDDLIPSHLVFLKSREIILVEALKLDNVRPGIYNLHCLPLRLRGAEGCPIRCILMK